jgi:hypothetical protein
MKSLYEVVQHLLLTAERDGHQEPAVAPSQVARASGRPPREVRTSLEALIKQGALRRASYLLADCPCCGMSLRVPAPVTVGYAQAAPPVPLRLAAVWCPGCQQLHSSGDLHAEPAYARASATFGAAG